MIVREGNRWFRMLVPGLLISLSLQAQQGGSGILLPVAAAASSENKTAADAQSTKDEIALLKAQLAEQQKQLEQLRATLEKQQSAIERATASAASTEPHNVGARAPLGEVASTTPMLPMTAIVAPANPTTTIAAAQTQQQPGKGESPLGIHLGAATFTPLGFVDFISVTRSTDVGSGVGTSFNSLPLSNTALGGLSEERLSMQNSRIGLRVDSVFKDIKVLGYLESDFLGNAPNNLFVTSNSDTLRLRLYFVDLKKDAFELTGGQTWSLMTPDRKGIGVLPADLFYTQNVDTNYQAGLTWARQTGMRFTWNPNDHFHWAVALENPEQYLGASGAVVLPKALAANSGFVSELGTGSATNVPNLFPDVISKIAFDGGAPGHAAHLEFGGVLVSNKTFNPLTTGAGADTRFTKVGGGGQVNFNFELGRGFKLFSNNFAGNGAGRYIQGLGPSFIIRSDGSISLVHSGSTVDGFEFQATPKTMFYAYYGGLYYSRNTALDADGKTLIGYGFSGAPGGANRTIQEATFGFQNNFWKSPQYGALMLAIQYSYVNRGLWYAASGTPGSADTHMGYINLRYTLP